MEQTLGPLILGAQIPWEEVLRLRASIIPRDRTYDMGDDGWFVQPPVDRSYRFRFRCNEDSASFPALMEHWDEEEEEDYIRECSCEMISPSILIV